MTINLSVFDTAVLNRVVSDLTKEVNAWFLRTFFPLIQTSDSEFILFDVEKVKPRITPFVASHLPGKVVDNNGYETNQFKPAYAKDKRRFEPKGNLKRQMGEGIGGTLSPEQRAQMRVRNALTDQLTMLTRREEVMAAEVLRTGKVTVSGEGFDTQIVDFDRDAALTITLAGNDRWNVDHADSNPNEDLENASVTMASKGGGAVTDYVMAPDAWQNYRTRLIARDEARGILDFQRSGTNQAELGPIARGLNEAVLVARYSAFNIWMYDDVYLDDAGAEQHLMPSGTVVGVNANALEGTRCYGMIEDEEANFASERFFSKSWLEKDPSVRWLLLQSAPLIVPYRPNASVKLAVL